MSDTTASARDDVVAGAEPLSAPGAGDAARTGVLVLHGFTGSPHSMRPWASALVDAGYAVEMPRLPGHGTSWQDMAKTGWKNWYDAAAAALTSLGTRCSSVFVVGLSMGGTLSLRLAETHSSVVRGVVTVNPSLVTPDPRMKLLPLLKLVIPSLPGIGDDIKKPGVEEGAYRKVPLKALASFLAGQKQTLAGLGSITCPVLTYRSADDHVVAPVSGSLLLSGVADGLVTEVVLTESYHVATLDNDAPAIFAGSLDFIEQCLAAV